MVTYQQWLCQLDTSENTFFDDSTGSCDRFLSVWYDMMVDNSDHNIPYQHYNHTFLLLSGSFYMFHMTNGYCNFSSKFREFMIIKSWNTHLIWKLIRKKKRHLIELLVFYGYNNDCSFLLLYHKIYIHNSLIGLLLLRSFLI